ncbi:MAG: histidinol-phosphatase HisJ family protein [Clostridia bacterium]|nr:histidinol-phosphatase HisJ family protein [Clostridia bacterium]
MITDLHSHCERSFDCEIPFAVMCDSAVERGVKVFALTDHCDLTPVSDEAAVMDNIRLSLSDAQMQGGRLDGTLKVVKGIELGQPLHNLPIAEKIVCMEGVDFILCSIHEIIDKQDFYYLNYNNEDVDDLLTKYFEEVLETVRWNKFDSLAHLTYPIRYICGEYGIAVDLSKYSAVIDEILSLLAKNGKALEINSSGLGMKIKETLPPRAIIARFRQLGGEYITIGSDAHLPQNVGYRIDEVFALVRECGFDSVTYFENHKPVKVRI